MISTKSMSIFSLVTFAFSYRATRIRWLVGMLYSSLSMNPVNAPIDSGTRFFKLNLAIINLIKLFQDSTAATSCAPAEFYASARSHT